MAVIPVVGGATVCVDDFVWVTNAWSRESLVDALGAAWTGNFFYRPLDIVANRLVDPNTLGIQPILAVQILGLLILTIGMWRLLALLGARSAISRTAATIWLWLHPATQLSIWSAGCSSQTWSAAMGIWMLCVVFASGGRPGGWRLAGKLLLLSSLGILAKELFLGWATAAAVALLMGAVGGRGGRTAIRMMTGILPQVCAVMIPPAAWIAVRLMASRFGQVLALDSDGLYAIHGPVTIVKNLLICLLGMFVQGPVHWARLLGLPWCLVPFVGAALSLWLSCVGGRRVGNVMASPVNLAVLPCFVLLGALSVWPALGIAHVSELYLMGANALVATLVGNGVARAPQMARRNIIGIAFLYVIAGIGFASRAYHFSVTWAQARELRAAVHNAVAEFPTSDRLILVVPQTLRDGPMHSKYLVPPAVAAALPESWRVRRLANPALPEVDFIGAADDAPAAGVTRSLEIRTRRRAMW